MAVFTRPDVEGRLHCEVMAYFSPAASDVAKAFDAEPCEKPARMGLGLLAGMKRPGLLYSMKADSLFMPRTSRKHPNLLKNCKPLRKSGILSGKKRRLRAFCCPIMDLTLSAETAPLNSGHRNHSDRGGMLSYEPALRNISP